VTFEIRAALFPKICILPHNSDIDIELNFPMIYSPQENRQFHVFARFARFQTSRLAAGICNRHAAKLSLPMHSKMCPHCHSGGRAWLAAPCRAARDLLLMVLCRAMGLSRVPVRSRPTTRSLAHARATALAHVQRVCCAHALGQRISLPRHCTLDFSPRTHHQVMSAWGKIHGAMRGPRDSRSKCVRAA